MEQQARELPRRQREETAIVLEFLQHGYPFDTRPSHRKTPIVQAIGKTKFTLLELVPKSGIFLQPLEEVYIGDGKRDKIHHIAGRLTLDKLTGTAKSQLDFVITDLIKKHEPQFVAFFNKAGPLTTRMHQLELLPGVGRKHMLEILDARRDGDFKSFADIRKRVKLMPDPEKIVLRRIQNELAETEKHRLFVD